VTNTEKAEEFAQLLSQFPSLLTICMSKDCTIADHLRADYPDMITLEWELHVPDLAVTERGISGTLAFSPHVTESVFVPWDAIVDVRVSAPPPPRLTLIKGGRESS
jgi:hypothetical protein